MSTFFVLSLSRGCRIITMSDTRNSKRLQNVINGFGIEEIEASKNWNHCPADYNHVFCFRLKDGVSVISGATRKLIKVFRLYEINPFAEGKLCLSLAEDTESKYLMYSRRS